MGRRFDADGSFGEGSAPESAAETCAAMEPVITPEIARKLRLERDDVAGGGKCFISSQFADACSAIPESIASRRPASQPQAYHPAPGERIWTPPLSERARPRAQQPTAFHRVRPGRERCVTAHCCARGRARSGG